MPKLTVSLAAAGLLAALVPCLSSAASPDAACCASEATAAPASPATARAAFDSLKALAGAWKPAGEEKATHVYRVTAGGSTVLETIFPGTPKEMITAYYLDGESLVLTHYCVLGNRPHMRAASPADATSVAFSCASGSSVKSEDERHMHSALFQMPDADHLTVTWSLRDEGKEIDTVRFALERAAR